MAVLQRKTIQNPIAETACALFIGVSSIKNVNVSHCWDCTKYGFGCNRELKFLFFAYNREMNDALSDKKLLDRLGRVSRLLEEAGARTIGNRVRRLRDAQGVSIREVAEKAEISKNSIVRLEQGRGTQPITILKVCSTLGVHVERLAEPASEDVVAATHRAKDDRWFDLADMGSQPLLDAKKPLTKQQRKKAVAAGATLPVNLLKSRLPGGKFLPSVLEVYGSSPVRSHVGEEFAYVLEGEAVITVGKKKHRLKQGESITFWSAEPHSYAPADPEKGPVRILSLRVDG